ncbi:MAG: hemolysin III family protein [Peptococcaceae bacterium]|nr:hemolysin III family protein [Peptococcaceae bacterium]
MSHYLMKAREPWSSFTHFLGAIFFGVATIFLVIKALAMPSLSPGILLGVIIFGASLIALYTASAVYHYSNGSDKKILVLRKLDHSMIYVLIAGSYTPVLIKFLPQRESLIFVSAIWLCAIVGTVIKLCWFSAPRWLQTVLYIAMGWAILFDISIFKEMSGMALFLLAAGGISYTVGGLIYIIKKPNFSPDFGFHEFFHLFVLLGSVFHYLMIFFYVA